MGLFFVFKIPRREMDKKENSNQVYPAQGYPAQPPPYTGSFTSQPMASSQQMPYAPQYQTQYGMQTQPVQFVTVAPETRNCNRALMPSIGCPIASCIFCWPLGIGSLLCYLQAESALERDDSADFENAAKATRGLTIASIVLGVLSIVIGLAIGIWYAVAVAAAVRTAVYEHTNYYDNQQNWWDDSG